MATSKVWVSIMRKDHSTKVVVWDARPSDKDLGDAGMSRVLTRELSVNRASDRG